MTLTTIATTQPALEVLGGVFVVVLGACLGSFAAVAATRLPKRESLGGRSMCVCGEPVLARDNLPIVGFLVRRGHARCCGAKIPSWYVLTELGFAVVALTIYLLAVG